jgi:hypothetical protein
MGNKEVEKKSQVCTDMDSFFFFKKKKELKPRVDISSYFANPLYSFLALLLKGCFPSLWRLFNNNVLFCEAKKITPHGGMLLYLGPLFFALAF